MGPLDSSQLQLYPTFLSRDRFHQSIAPFSLPTWIPARGEEGGAVPPVSASSWGSSLSLPPCVQPVTAKQPPEPVTPQMMIQSMARLLPALTLSGLVGLPLLGMRTVGPSMQLTLAGHGWKAPELVPGRKGYDAEMEDRLGFKGTWAEPTEQH